MTEALPGQGAQPLDQQLLAQASKVIAVHLNYPSRAAQRGRTPAFPSYFLKPSTSLSLSGTVERPQGCELLGFEGEIALIVGSSARRVSADEGWSHIAWVTASNDLGLYDLRYADKGSNLRSKGGDGFTPLGPGLLPATELDPASITLRTWHEGRLVQEDSSAELLFPFGQLISDLSQLITLEPGDVILTGTPAGASVAHPGEIVEVEVTARGKDGTELSTGRLRTEVIAGSTPLPKSSAQPKADDTQRAEAWGTPLESTTEQPTETTETTESSVLTQELREMLSTVAVATLSAQLLKRGYADVSIDGPKPLRPGRRLLGTARTLRFVPYRKDLFDEHGGGYNAQKRAIDTLREGEVLVMEARGEAGTGTLGDLLALRALHCGAAGVVTDGGVRDYATVAAMDLPVYAQGAHPAVLGRRHVPWAVDETVSCGGATVQPGDIIVGDDDGVLVIPPQLAQEVALAAQAQEHQEEFVAQQIAAGHRVDGLYPLSGEWKEAYQQWAEQ